MRKRVIGMVAAAIATAVVPSIAITASASSQADAARAAHNCARQLDAAAREDMRSFAAYDERRWRAVHDERAITIFAGGRVANGIDETVTALAGHFRDRNATWTYTELNRVVDGCDTAFLLYDTTYAIPSVGFSQRAIVGVTYERKHGRWLVIADQNTLMP